MKGNIIKYLLIVSLLMNVSFLGAAVYTRYSHPRYRAMPLIYPGGASDKAAPFSHGSQGNCLFEELSLRPDQIKVFQNKATGFHKALDAKRQQVVRLRGSLVTILREDNPNRETIGRTIAEINGVQRDMQEMVVSHMLEFKSMLNSEQQKKFISLIQSAMKERRESVCP